MTTPVISAIHQRRSIRDYQKKDVETEKLYEILKAGIWAPSGLNNQPWRFAIIKDNSVRELLAEQTHYHHIVRAAPALIAVFLEKNAMYDEVKDHQSAGACIQNMLLAAEALDLGAVWLGQILKNKHQVLKILGLGEEFDLMALLAVGYPAHRDQKSTRKQLHEFILKEY